MAKLIDEEESPEGSKHIRRVSYGTANVAKGNTIQNNSIGRPKDLNIENDERTEPAEIWKQASKRVKQESERKKTASEIAEEIND